MRKNLLLISLFLLTSAIAAPAKVEAIEALHQLHATGRMVGAITHVEAMKQQLHVGIEVRRREDGRGSTLVVQP